MLLKSTFLPQTSSGWWFQTCFIFPDVGNVIIPTDELIFFRGVGLNHQPAVVSHNNQKLGCFCVGYKN